MRCETVTPRALLHALRAAFEAVLDRPDELQEVENGPEVVAVSGGVLEASLHLPFRIRDDKPDRPAAFQDAEIAAFVRHFFWGPGRPRRRRPGVRSYLSAGRRGGSSVLFLRRSPVRPLAGLSLALWQPLTRMGELRITANTGGSFSAGERARPRRHGHGLPGRPTRPWQRTVAIKLIEHRSFSAEDDAVSRFLRERPAIPHASRTRTSSTCTTLGKR